MEKMGKVVQTKINIPFCCCCCCCTKLICKLYADTQCVANFPNLIPRKKIKESYRKFSCSNCNKKACAFDIIVYHRRLHYVVVIVSMNEKWYIKRFSSSYAAESKTDISSTVHSFHVDNVKWERVRALSLSRMFPSPSHLSHFALCVVLWVSHSFFLFVQNT